MSVLYRSCTLSGYAQPARLPFQEMTNSGDQSSTFPVQPRHEIKIREIKVDGVASRRSELLTLVASRTKDGRYYELEADEELGIYFMAESLEDQILRLLETRWARYADGDTKLTSRARVLRDRLLSRYRVVR